MQIAVRTANHRCRQLSLALRPLSDAAVAKQDDPVRKKRVAAAAYDGPVSVIRYGMNGSGNRQEPQ